MQKPCAIQSRMTGHTVKDLALVPCLVIFSLITGARAEQLISDSGAIALASVIGALVLIVTIAVVCYCFRKYTLDDKDKSRKLADIRSYLIESSQLEHDSKMTQNGYVATNGHVSDKIKTYGESSQLEHDSKMTQNGYVATNGHVSDKIKTYGESSKLEHDSKMTQNGYVATNGHVSDKIKTYGEWRKSQKPSNLYTKHYSTSGQNTHYTTTTGGHYATVGHNTTGYRIRRGSESPPLSPRSPGTERGRTARRQFVYQMPAGSVAVRRAVVRPKLRSKSAPPVQRYSTQTGYNVVYPKFEKIGYTRNHFLSIKKPFGKKYLLPPTLVYKEQPRLVQKNVVMPVPEPRPAPVQYVSQPQRETIKGNVYHIKYENGNNQRVSSTNGYADQSHSRVEQQYSHPRSEQYTYTRSEQQHAYPRNVTSTSSRVYAEPSSPIRPATYTVKYGEENYDLVNEKSNIYTLQTSGAANQSVWANELNYNRATTVYTTNDDDDAVGEVFRQSISTSEVRASVKGESKEEEQYTIVDFVEEGTETKTAENPMSTSTPRFPDQDDVQNDDHVPTTPVTPLRDLDNVLNGNDDTSSSSSSSSRNSSGSDGNQ